MNAADHRERAARIERSIAKLAPEDYEMRIEAAMLAGTHWLNAALHDSGVTAPAADVLHTYMLVVNELRRLRVADATRLDALTAIEDLRPAFVRGNAAGGEAAATHAMELLALLRSVR